MLDHTSSNLASNLKRLREARDLTQAELAKLSAVPRPTLAHLESGGANPTLGVLLKVADALRVPIEELIRSPRPAVIHYPATALVSKTRGRVKVRQLLVDHIPGMAIERFELPVGSRLPAGGGSPAARQYLTCESGELEVSRGDDVWRLHLGDLMAMRGDQAHVLVNRGRGKAVAYRVTAPAPLAE